MRTRSSASKKTLFPSFSWTFIKVRFTNLRRLLQYGGETLPSGQGLVLVGSCCLVNVGRIFWTQPQWMMEMISSGPIVEECWGCSNLLGGCLPPPSEQDLALFVQRALSVRQKSCSPDGVAVIFAYTLLATRDFNGETCCLGGAPKQQVSL